MLQIGVQTKEIINDSNPEAGFAMLKKAGFTCADFSLNSYLSNKDIYKSKLNRFFDKSVEELEQFFTPHKQGAKKNGITINQMHMPYPIYQPTGSRDINDYLWKEVALKSIEICRFLECPNIVIHGFKLAWFLGTEELEWQETAKFIDSIAMRVKEYGITICIENLYDSMSGHFVEGPCCDARLAADRIDFFNEKYNAEVLGFCFDTGHANIVGIDFEQFITTLGSRLKVLHVHDNDGIGDLHQLPFTFTRERENKTSTDWDGFIKGLRNIGYNKVINFETAPVLSAYPEAMRDDVLSLIAKTGEYFIGEIAKKD